MTAPRIHGPRRTFSASAALEVQVNVLREIKRTDGLTYGDLGRYLGGKSDDRARVYAPGEDSETPPSAIDMLTFLAACETWGGRFADSLLGLVGGRWADTGAICTSDESGALSLATLLPAIMQVEADGITEAHELLPHEELIRRVNLLTTHWLEMIARRRAGGEQ